MIRYGQQEMDYVAGRDPVMAALVEKYGYIPAGEIDDVFESIVVHIIEQQLSNRVAAVITARFRALVGAIRPDTILSHSTGELKSCGLSMKKAEYIRLAAERAAAGDFDFAALEAMTDAEVIDYLTSIKGVGRWTAEMIVPFTMGRPDIFSYTDVALINGMKKAHGFKTVSPLRFSRMQKKYSPFCSIAALYYYAVNDETP